MGKVMLLEFPFEYIRVEKLGVLFYPMVRVELLTTSGWREFEFLVDTGADVTTIPASVAAILDLDLSVLSKNVVIGVGGQKVMVKETILPMRIGNMDFKASVNITNGGNAFLLGKKDVFEEKFSLIIDSVRKMTTLKRN